MTREEKEVYNLLNYIDHKYNKGSWGGRASSVTTLSGGTIEVYNILHPYASYVFGRYYMITFDFNNKNVSFNHGGIKIPLDWNEYIVIAHKTLIDYVPALIREDLNIEEEKRAKAKMKCQVNNRFNQILGVS